MFYLNKETELTKELLGKMISRFTQNELPRMTKYKSYYDGKQKILEKSYADPTKPCNRTVINYAANIANSYAGYLAAPSYISYRSEQDIEEIMNILRYNDYQEEDSSFLLDALVYGVACELMYLDEESNVRFRLINPTSCFGIYDDSLTGDLTHFVRFYKASEWDNSNTFNVDVYDSASIKHYKMTGTNGTLDFIGEEPHYFSQCPANIFALPDNKSIFDCIMTLQDAANELLSAEVDEIQAFCDAYLILEGGNLDNETVSDIDGLTDVQRMRQSRILELPEGAKAYWLTKSVNDTQIENIMKRIHDSIYRVSQCVDFSNESFTGGVSSGVAIRFKLCGMETRGAKIVAQMKKALQRRVELISGVASLKLGEEVFRDIQIDFKRNIPEDLTATINLINTLKGSVSDATLLGQLPFITDVNAELEALQEQKAANMELYGFTAPSTEEEEE